MTIRCGPLVPVSLLLACWCAALAAQPPRPVDDPARPDLPAIDDAAAAAGDEAEQASQEGLSFALPATEDFAPPAGPWIGRVLGIPGPEPIEKRYVPGLPTFSRNVVARGKSYRFTMVGADPFLARSGRVVIAVQIIPVRVVFNGQTTLDPTVPLPGCAGPGTPLTNTLQSPVFTDFDYGDGPRQYVEQNRRFEFWAVTGNNPGYSVRVAPTVLPTITLTVNGSILSAPCGLEGVVSATALQTLIENTLLPMVARQGVNPKTFPIFLFYNVVAPDPVQGGLILGYHSRHGAQTYGVVDYDTSQYFGHIADVAVLSHELAEWYDDPFVNNATPPWGNLGVLLPGCHAYLEVGDPLSYRVLEIQMPNGLTYHPQELAFFSWFFDQVPSLGLKGLYSWGGTFTRPASLCK